MKLDAFAKVDLDFTDAPLQEVVNFLAECGGVPCDLRAATTETLTVSTTGDDQTLRDLFAMVTARVGLDFAADENGTLVITRPGRTPHYPNLRARLELERARRLTFGDEGGKSPSAHRTEHRLNLRFHVTPLAEVITFLREFIGISIILHPEAGDPEPITLEAEGWTLDEVMSEICRQTGREMVVRAALVILDRAEAERLRAERARRAGVAVEILGRAVEFRGQALEAWRLGEFLGSRARVEIVVGEELWVRVDPMRLPEEPSTLGKGLEDLAARIGLRWRVVGGVVYLF